ncbi:hypothetical protein V8C86DRAFT_3114038 [Haematococcus lacustris]
MRPDASPAQALMQHASRRGRVSPSHSQKPGIAASLPRHAVAAVAMEERVSTPQQQTAVTENVVIVGSGPAGYTAAIYAARAHLKPVVFEGFQNGKGGQLMGTTEVENFPGFPEGVTGPELMERMRKQSERWGAELYTEDVEFIDLSRRPFTVRSAEREVRAHSLIIATGATARKLGIPSEQTFWSKGISACAICDGASPLFKNKPVAVVGGGDSAAEEAVYLTKYASHVHLLVRGSKLRASKAMADRCLANPLITVHFNTGVEDAEGNGVLAGLQLVDTQTGEKRRLDVAGLFYGIGHTPNTQLLGNQIELDSKGYVKVQHGVATSVEGVFAAGDLHDPEWRQAITAAGSGCMAALSVERYLTQHGLAQEFKPSAEQEEEEEGHGKAAAPAARSMSEDPEALFDVLRDKHRGQFALRKLYHESERLIAVLYTSPSCGPCRSLKPILNAVVDEFPGRLHYVEVDIEADPEIAEAAGINGTPTLQLFKNKDMLQVVPGVKQKREYRELLKTNL